MFTVHALGGEAMVAAAVRGAAAGADESGHPMPIVLAVTRALEPRRGGRSRRPRRSPSRRRRRAPDGVVVSGEDVVDGARGGGRGAVPRGPRHPSRGLERTRSGSRPHAGGGDRTRRRLSRHRSADHRVVRTPPARRARSSRRFAEEASRTENRRSQRMTSRCCGAEAVTILAALPFPVNEGVLSCPYPS